MATTEEKRREAICRMKAFEINDDVIELFSSSLLPYIYDCTSYPCCFREMTNQELNEVLKFDREHNSLVYFVIKTLTDFGVHDSYLYVSNYDEEWEIDREDIDMNQPLVYVVNHDIPEFSEFGAIVVEREGGGLFRVD